jgi:actin cytoskeleton-regulatory complex protein SLA1
LQQPAYTGYNAGQPQGVPSFPTGAPGPFIQPMMTGAPGQGPFADPGRQSSFSPIQAQPTGFQPQPFSVHQTSYAQQHQGGINSFLPPALEPQRTGVPNIQPQMTGIGGLNQSAPLQPIQALQPQQTGPAPPVRFGVTGEAKKIAAQPTGRRANLAQASKFHLNDICLSACSQLLAPQNPFGF